MATTNFVVRELWRATRKLLCASPRYVEARGLPHRVEDLARHDCIAVHATEGMATWTLGQGRRRRRVTFEPRFYVSESSAAYRATLAGVGIAMLPEVFCAEEVWHGEPMWRDRASRWLVHGSKERPSAAQSAKRGASVCRGHTTYRGDAVLDGCGGGGCGGCGG